MKVVDNKIVYKYSGVQAIENYILARYHMYWQVYYHPTSRSYEQLLICIFRRIKDLYNEGYDFGDIRYLKPFLEGEVNEADYVKLDESIVLYYFRLLSESDDEILADLCERFLNRKLFIYRDLNNEEEKIKIINKFRQSGVVVRYYVVSDDQSQIPYMYYDNDDVQAIEVLVNHDLKLLPEVSEIVGAITYSSKNKIDHKIFYPE